MDYQEWAPRSAEPPKGRAVEPHDAQSERPQAPGRHGSRDYADHGYWEDRYSGRSRTDPPAAYSTGGLPVAQAWPSNDTGQQANRRDGRDNQPSGQMVPVASAYGPRTTGPAAALGGFDDHDRDYPAVLWWTAIWYAVSLVLYVTMSLTRGSTPEAGCATATGGTCGSPRSHALDVLWGHALGVLLAIAISLAVAALIRRVSLDWRAISVGLAAAIVGSGIATLLIAGA